MAVADIDLQVPRFMKILHKSLSVEIVIVYNKLTISESSILTTVIILEEP